MKDAPRASTADPAANGGRDWSAADVADLRRFAGQGLKARTIALRLGRTPSAVRGKAHNSGVALVSDRARETIALRLAGETQAL